MQQIDSVATSNDFTNAATIQEVWRSSGGYFIVSDADVYMALQYGNLGSTEWTNPVHVPTGNGILNEGTIGVKFKSYTPNLAATVSAALSAQAEPTFAIGSGGQTGNDNSTLIQGVVTGGGTIAHGTGFSCARSSAGVYQLGWTIPFPNYSFAIPITVAPPALLIPYIPAGSGSGITLVFKDLTGTLTDTIFGFIATGG